MWSLIDSLVSLFYDSVTYVSIRLVVIALVLTLAYQYGYIHRFLWWFAEAECTKLVNHVQVTIGGIQRLDLLRGEFELSNIVIHSPNRALWSSPIIARIGSAKVSVNALQCFCSLWFLGEELPLDFYSIHVADIQVFVERRCNVYNFFLLDKNIILPDAFLQLNATTAATTRPAVSIHHHNEPDRMEEHTDDTSSHDTIDGSTADTKSSPALLETQDTAAAIVDDMLDAVKRAAAAGSADPLLSHYKDRLQESLRRFESTNTKTTTALVQTVELLKNVGMNITHKTEIAQQAVHPTRRPNPKTVYARIGRLDIVDMRIFPHNHTETPIWVSSLSIKPSELSSPVPFSDKPPFCRMEELMELVIKRIVAEMAKSDTGKFLQTAMQEMADALIERS